MENRRVKELPCLKNLLKIQKSVKAIQQHWALSRLPNSLLFSAFPISLEPLWLLRLAGKLFFAFRKPGNVGELDSCKADFRKLSDKKLPTKKALTVVNIVLVGALHCFATNSDKYFITWITNFLQLFWLNKMDNFLEASLKNSSHSRGVYRRGKWMQLVSS